MDRMKNCELILAEMPFFFFNGKRKEKAQVKAASISQKPIVSLSEKLNKPKAFIKLLFRIMTFTSQPV